MPAATKTKVRTARLRFQRDGVGVQALRKKSALTTGQCPRCERWKAATGCESPVEASAYVKQLKRARDLPAGPGDVG